MKYSFCTVIRILFSSYHKEGAKRANFFVPSVQIAKYIFIADSKNIILLMLTANYLYIDSVNLHFGITLLMIAERCAKHPFFYSIVGSYRGVDVKSKILLSYEQI